jgi:hypothetical protein
MVALGPLQLERLPACHPSHSRWLLSHRPGTIYKWTFEDLWSQQFIQKEDAPKQSREARHERRKQVVRMHRKGVGVMQIVEQTGLSWTAVNTALRLHSAGAARQLKPGIRGKKPGSGRSLSPAQEQAVQQAICDKRPEQLKMDFALRSRPAVRQHIALSLGIKLSIRAVGNYLARGDLRVHHSKPVKPEHLRTPRALSCFIYPAIAQSSILRSG